MADKRIPEKVLIILLGAIGDVCRALPLAVRIRRNWPDTAIHWAIEPKSRALVENHPAIDRVIVFDRPRGLSAYREFTAELRRERYDLVLDLQRHFKSGMTSFLTRAQRRIGFHRRNAKEFNWLFQNEQIGAVPNFSAKIGHYQLFGDQIGLARMTPLEFELKPTSDSVARVEQLLSEQGFATLAPERAVAVIMGSSWPSRFWPAASYRELFVELTRRWNFVPLLVGGNGEEKITLEALDGLNASQICNLVSRTTLADVIAVIARSAFTIGPDSGPAHIASALGKRVITIFGSTSAERSAPYGSEQLTLSSVVGCSPCYLRECPGLGTICMREIPAEAVCAQIARLMENR